MSDELRLRIGRSNRGEIVISPTCRERPDASDYWDGNWIHARVRVVAGAFQGEYEAQLRAEDFVTFRDALKQLHEALDGRASFETMEGWIAIRIEGDGRGHFTAECEAIDMPGTGNRLSFGIDFDQTDIPEMVLSLNAICESFPVVGRR